MADNNVQDKQFYEENKSPPQNQPDMERDEQSIQMIQPSPIRQLQENKLGANGFESGRSITEVELPSSGNADHFNFQNHDEQIIIQNENYGHLKANFNSSQRLGNSLSKLNVGGFNEQSFGAKDN